MPLTLFIAILFFGFFFNYCNTNTYCKETNFGCKWIKHSPLKPLSENKWGSLACETKLGQEFLLWRLLRKPRRAKQRNVSPQMNFKEHLTQRFSLIEEETEAQSGISKAKTYTVSQWQASQLPGLMAVTILSFILRERIK